MFVNGFYIIMCGCCCMFVWSFCWVIHLPLFCLVLYCFLLLLFALVFDWVFLYIWLPFCIFITGASLQEYLKSCQKCVMRTSERNQKIIDHKERMRQASPMTRSSMQVATIIQPGNSSSGSFAVPPYDKPG